MALTAIRTVFRRPRMTLAVADNADGADANVGSCELHDQISTIRGLDWQTVSPGQFELQRLFRALANRCGGLSAHAAPDMHPACLLPTARRAGGLGRPANKRLGRKGRGSAGARQCPRISATLSSLRQTTLGSKRRNARQGEAARDPPAASPFCSKSARSCSQIRSQRWRLAPALNERPDPPMHNDGPGKGADGRSET